MIIKMEHCRQARYCSAGVRNFFKQYGLDYSDFLRNGLEQKEFLSRTGNDALIVKLIKVAHGQE